MIIFSLGAKNSKELRNRGLKDCRDYKKVARSIKDGAYAICLTYVEKRCSIIEKWNLTQYDVKSSGSTDEKTPAFLTNDLHGIRKCYLRFDHASAAAYCRNDTLTQTVLHR